MENPSVNFDALNEPEERMNIYDIEDESEWESDFSSSDLLRKNCPYSELFWFAFSRIGTEYGGIIRISPYSVRMRKNAGQNNSEYGRSDFHAVIMTH